MRLSEFSAPAATNSESTLATLLQFLLSKADMPNIGDKSAKEIKIPTDTIIQLMKNQGLGFSYADLDAATKAALDKTDADFSQVVVRERVVRRPRRPVVVRERVIVRRRPRRYRRPVVVRRRVIVR